MAKQYFVLRNEQVTGPFSKEQLQAISLSATDQLSTTANGPWETIEAIIGRSQSKTISPKTATQVMIPSSSTPQARTKQCTDCGGMVSVQVQACPHCGAPTTVNADVSPPVTASPETAENSEWSRWLRFWKWYRGLAVYVRSIANFSGCLILSCLLAGAISISIGSDNALAGFTIGSLLWVLLEGAAMFCWVLALFSCEDHISTWEVRYQKWVCCSGLRQYTHFLGSGLAICLALSVIMFYVSMKFGYDDDFLTLFCVFYALWLISAAVGNLIRVSKKPSTSPYLPWNPGHANWILASFWRRSVASLLSLGYLLLASKLSYGLMFSFLVSQGDIPGGAVLFMILFGFALWAICMFILCLPLLLYYGVFPDRSSGLHRLRNGLENPTGRTRAEVEEFLGPPTSESILVGGYLLQWLSQGRHLALIFNHKNICQGISHRHNC